MTRKITRGVAAIVNELQRELFLGNLSAKRDWGHAGDFAEGIWQILQQDEPDDYVLATGSQHSVREFVELAFASAGRTIGWEGEGIDEVGRDMESGTVLVRIDPRYFRPTEVDTLLGDASKANRVFGWAPPTSFASLVKEMVESDLKLVPREASWRRVVDN